MKKTLIMILAIFLICGFALASYLTVFSRVNTNLELDQSVIINGKSIDEPIETTIKTVAGNKESFDILIENRCNEPVNISISHTCDEGINVYVLYNEVKINFPITLDPNSEYNAKIIYKTNHRLKQNIYLVVSEFYFVD